MQAYAKQQRAAKQARASAGFSNSHDGADGMSPQHLNMLVAAFVERMIASILQSSTAGSRAVDVEEL
jgi:hypothetical protein